MAFMLLFADLFAVENQDQSLSTWGILDSAGGSAESPKLRLLGGSLGGTIQTGKTQSTGLILESGYVFGSVQKLTEELPGDFDGNGKVEFTDFVIFARGYGKSSGQEGFVAKLDLNNNGRIDFADFVEFARAYGG